MYAFQLMLTVRVYVAMATSTEKQRDEETRINRNVKTVHIEFTATDEINIKDQNDNKAKKSTNKHRVIHIVPNTWLRVYPAPKVHGEPLCSVIFRCLVCQIGLASFLVLWTILWVLIIHSMEGPNEAHESIEFQDQQNQLIIDLATELRQITPVSPKWRAAIEARIEEERRLTIRAVGGGAHLHPGSFWDVPGTFLFAVYVMAALGFGAPVPQTLYGRISTLAYAALAVPIHIYLLMNASTCIVIYIEEFIQRMGQCLKNEPSVMRKTKLEHNTESPNCSRNSELLKSSSKRTKCLCFLKAVSVGRAVPIAIFLYYICGAVFFGICRSKRPLEVVMFPLEFTTSGGLEHIANHVRVLYALYVEGAMWVLACALATLRRRSGGAVAAMSQKYRLFEEKGTDCSAD